jgi:PncC family amidohydrolase
MDGNQFEVHLGELLRARGWTLATAESCTGGLLGHRITNVPGSSDYYIGGVTSYAYKAKVGLLGVHWETLDKYGAVSEQVVLEMARGVRRVLGADLGVSISGVAGPGGGTSEKPVGLVWIALSAREGDWARRFLFSGERLAIKRQSAQAALQILVDYLEENYDGGH